MDHSVTSGEKMGTTEQGMLIYIIKKEIKSS